MKTTSRLALILQNYSQTLPLEQYQSFRNEVDVLIKKYLSNLSKFEPGKKRGDEIHRLLDYEIEKASAIKTSCFKGCGYCCHLEIEITQDDSEVLAEAIYQAHQRIDFEKLVNISQRERQSPEWKNRDVFSNRCILLGPDNCCTQYQNRPMVCRKHSVISLPEECRNENGAPVAREIPMAEIIISAAMNLDKNEHGQFAKMLLRSIQTLEKKNQDLVDKIHELKFEEADLIPKNIIIESDAPIAPKKNVQELPT